MRQNCDELVAVQGARIWCVVEPIGGDECKMAIADSQRNVAYETLTSRTRGRSGVVSDARSAINNCGCRGRSPEIEFSFLKSNLVVWAGAVCLSPNRAGQATQELRQC
jgi:hypothetical protein